MEIPKEQQYEYLTHHLEYLNEKIIEAFVLFIKLATAIVGGVFFLHWKLGETDPKRTFFVRASDILFLLFGFCMGLLILNNLRAWRGYRRTLAEQYPGIKPMARVASWLSELLMCLVIVATCVVFYLFNPLGR